MTQQRQPNLRQLSDEELGAQLKTARDELARLKAGAERLDREADEARERFERTPDASTVAARDVKAQLAKNAHAAVAERAAELEPTFAEETRRSRVRRLAELREALDVQGEFEAVAHRVVEIYAAFSAELQDQVNVFVRTLEARDSVLAEANSLEKVVGDGRKHERLTFPYSFEQHVQAAVVARFGPSWGDHVNYGAGARLKFVDHLNLQFVEAAIRFNTKIPYRLL